MTVPPLRRDDVTREVDLIEEVARIDGLERLPATLPARRGAAGRLTHAQRVRRAAEDALVGRGLHEIVGWSFTDPGLLDRLRLPPEHAMRRVVRVENPLSEDAVDHAPDAARLAARRRPPQRRAQRPRPRDLRVRAPSTAPTAERRRSPTSTTPSACCSAARSRRAPGAATAGEADFFAAKALLAALLDALPRRAGRSSPAAMAVPASRPQRRGARRRRRRATRLGFVGELHPLVAGAWDLERTAAFAIDLGKLAAAAPPVAAFRAFGAFPSLRQDLAVTLPEQVSRRRAARARARGRRRRCSRT